MKNILLKHLLFSRRSSPTQSQAGFTMIELIVITVIIGVLSAIGAAGWNAFITRQRIRTVNDQVFQALRSAQSDAKLKKEIREVVFVLEKETSSPKEIYIYNAKAPDDLSNSQGMRSIDLSNDGQIKKGQTKTTLKYSDNNTDFSLLKEFASYKNLGEVLKGFKVIRFDYLGALPSDTTLPIKITTSTPQDGMKRCIIVETLLGGMRSAQGSECP